ncbi:MAG: hypothetical protein M0R28_21270 [Pigmentiphaga sp.]|nr:hypothetical protein [Pigmentiphaga sp.]
MADTPPASVVPELRRLTTQYLDTEDRIRLTGESADGDVWVLWLTQRLLQRLLPPLFSWLDTTVAKPPRTHDGPAPTPATNEEADQRHHQAQRAAVSSHAAQRPVAIPPDTREILIQSIDLSHFPRGVRLTFKAAGQASPSTVRLSLPTQALRQWLRVLYQQYRKAGWPLQHWPDWLRGDPGQAAPTSARVLH